MVMSTAEIDIIKQQTSLLSKEQKAQLIEFLTKSLKSKGPGNEVLRFGKYKNSGMRESTEEDFRIAEWHPDVDELDGN